MLRNAHVLLVLIALLAAPSAVAAQGSGTRFAAITGGATLSDISGFAASSDSRWGGTAGLMFGYNAGPTAAVIEGNWIQKGGEDIRLDYIEVPLTFGAVGVTGAGANRGRVYTGLSIAFKVGCSSTLVVCDDAKGTEWGWPLGLQYARAMENGNFFGFDVRYTVALSQAFDSFESHNRPWQFRLMFGKQLGMSSR